MAKALTQAISTQITNKDIKRLHRFLIDSRDFTSSVLSWEISFSKEFGSASATFTLNNSTGRFSVGSTDEPKVGAIVELIESFKGDSTEFKSFYGKIEQRSISKKQRTITLTCLDYISVLRYLDIDLISEGTKVKVENENLTPNYLPAPNSMFAQIFNFDNNSIADNPRPIIVIKDKALLLEDPQNSGFDILYEQGQLKMGSPLNARDNFDIIAKQYYFYVSGIFVEDALEQILTQSDGYNKYLFGETTSTAVINNHLRSTYQDEEGAGKLDNLFTTTSIITVTIRHTVTAVVNAGASTVTLDSIDGLPSAGEGTINGDTFSWTNIIASTKTLVGVPSSGAFSLKAHPVSSLMKYDKVCPSGQLWYLKYSNLISTLALTEFQLPANTNVAYVDHRNGRIVLDRAISTSSSVICNRNYEFKTLQASGIELNKISFRSRELSNRFEAIEKLRSYIAPNYIIRTQGDNKIWASYLEQKTTADYTLNLVQAIDYLEDEDIYTRVKFFGKHKNPTNIMFDENIDFVTTGESYTSITNQTSLDFETTEGSWHVFKTLISDIGKIILDTLVPTVYINGVPIDNTLRLLANQPVRVQRTSRTETEVESSKWGGTDVSVRTFTYYKILFAHQSIEPSKIIQLHNPNGVTVMTISPYDSNMNYGTGIYEVPGDQENATIETISTASYYILYSTQNLQIDYDTARFRISNSLLPDPDNSLVQATFEYYTVFTPQRGVASLIDGRLDTQVQSEFFSEPPSGYRYAIIDLGQTRVIQAIDVIAGFYKPDEFRKFDIDMRLTLQYSTDNVTYFDISDETHNFQLTGGEAKSFEEDALGIGFEARYILVILERVGRVEFGNGVYPVAFTEISIYENIIIDSEITLIPTATLTQNVTSASTTIAVDSTSSFDTPASASTETVYLGTTPFTYTGLTATSFTGCVVGSGVTAATGTKIYKDLETSTTVKDDDNLLDRIGDKVYKDVRINDQLLYTQSQLDVLAKAFLKEFYKDHTKATTDVLFAPYLKVGQTVALTDSYNNVSSVRYFIESVNHRPGFYNLTLARFP